MTYSDIHWSELHKEKVSTCSVTWPREVAMIQQFETVNNNWGYWEILLYTSKNRQLKQETKYSISNCPYELSNNAQFSSRQDYKPIVINSSLVKSCSISIMRISILSLFVPSNSRTWLGAVFFTMNRTSNRTFQTLTAAD